LLTLLLMGASMGSTANKGSGRLRFTYRVVLPVVAAVGITVATVAGFVYWSTAKSDDRALARETHLVAQVIATEIKTLTGQQNYYSDWDEAITALKDKDLDWIDENLASELYSNDHFDRIYVLDPAARPLYAMYGGGKTAAQNFEADRAAVAPLVARLKDKDAAGALAAYDSGNSDTVPNVAEIGLIDGRPAYLGVSAIMSESGDDGMEVEPGHENFLICVRFLDGALVKDFAEQYFIDSPSFAATAAPDQASYPLADQAGQTVGWFSWNADRPGALILSETLPAMIGAFAIAGIVLMLLLRDLRRTTAELEEGRARAEYEANHDVLTGLANRAHFNRELEKALAGAPGDTSCIALLALDLDRFKQVNDTMGHEAGDQLLREVGKRLTPLVDADDTVARLGGDEFAIIQRGVQETADVSRLSDRIISEISMPFVLSGRVAQVGVSIGVVVTPASRAARDLTSKADIALYAAKASGRNTYRIFDDAMQKAATFRDKVGEELKDAGLPVPRDKVA
jgi:diguanylate cyclase (GGDEF)-like protein